EVRTSCSNCSWSRSRLLASPLLSFLASLLPRSRSPFGSMRGFAASANTQFQAKSIPPPATEAVLFCPRTGENDGRQVFRRRERERASATAHGSGAAQVRRRARTRAACGRACLRRARVGDLARDGRV